MDDLLEQRRRILEELHSLEKRNGTDFAESDRIPESRGCPLKRPASPNQDCKFFCPSKRLSTEIPMTVEVQSAAEETQKIPPPDSTDELKEGASEDQILWKTVLENMENDSFETLPEGWTRITHNSGLPVYLHRATRVVCISRPYFIGNDSVRGHCVPVSAVPCLQQKRSQNAKNPDDQPMTSQNANGELESDIRLEKIEDNRLEPPELTEYASSIFKFKKIPVKRFTSFRQKKLDRHEKKTEETLKMVGLTMDDIDDNQTTTKTATGVALINIPTQDARFNKKNFVMNPTGKTSVTILHEYVQRALKGRLVYDFTDNINSPSPHSARAVLYLKKQIKEQLPDGTKEKLAVLQMSAGWYKSAENNALEDEEEIVLGGGQGPNKKKAKLMAAEAALKVLIPRLAFDSNYTASLKETASAEENYDIKAIEVFENLHIDDPRIVDLCVRTGQPKPFQLLKDACSRLIKFQGLKPEVTTEIGNDHSTKVTVSVGKDSATVAANGAKMGRQRAAQALLKVLHPELKVYSSILKLYADAQEKQDRKDNAKTHEEVIRVQNKGPHSEPNYTALAMLRAEMHKVVVGGAIRPPSFTDHP